MDEEPALHSKEPEILWDLFCSVGIQVRAAYPGSQQVIVMSHKEFYGNVTLYMSMADMMELPGSKQAK